MRSRCRFAALSLVMYGLTACTPADPGYVWLLGGGIPAPAGTPAITGSFSLAISDVNGSTDFMFLTEQPVDLYAIALDINSPSVGSLVQIREMSGDATGRVVFRAVPAPSGNATGTWSIDPVTGAMRLVLDYDTRHAVFDFELQKVQQINRTFYLNVRATPGTEDPCAADQVAPVIAMSAVNRVWPPNHQMVKVATGISATDESGAATLTVSVASNEPIDGTGDGDTSPDWNIVETANGTYDVFARAERAGTGTGRIYTITATATDACQNIATRTATVLVPKSQSPR